MPTITGIDSPGETAADLHVLENPEMRDAPHSRRLAWVFALLGLCFGFGNQPRAVPALGIFSTHKGQVTAVAFGPNGRTLASLGDDGVKVWDVSQRRLLRENRHPSGIGDATFSPDGSRVAANESASGATSWDLDLGEEGRTDYWHPPRKPPEFSCYSVAYGWGVAYSPDGETLASGGSNQGEDGFVTFWDAATGEPKGDLKGHGSPVTSIAFSPRGDVLASASLDGTVKLWDVAARKTRMMLKGHESGVWSVRIAPDGGSLASAGGDRVVRFWDMATGSPTGVLSGHHDAVFCVAFSRDGRFVASGDAKGTVLVWDVARRRIVGWVHGHQSRVWSVAFSPIDNVFATAGEDGIIRLWGLP
jgi:WD40 repeat protein